MRRQDEVGGGDIGGGDSPEGVDEHASATSGGGPASRTARGIEGEARGDAGAEASGGLRSAFVPRAEEEGKESEVVGFPRFGNVSDGIIAFIGGSQAVDSQELFARSMATKFASSRLLTRQPEAC